MAVSAETQAQLDRFTTGETAEYFGVSRATIRNWIRDGCLEAERVTKNGTTGRVGRYIVSATELERIDTQGGLMIEEMRRKWPRMIWRKSRGLKV